MFMPLRRFVAAALLFSFAPLAAQDANTVEVEKVAFVDSGLPKGDPTAVLPGGWILAGRLTQLDRTLGRIDRLFSPFMAAEFLPQDKNLAARMKAPISTAMAEDSKFGPVTRANLLAKTGVDLGRPVVAAWYPNGGMPKNMSRFRKGLIVAIPISGDRELVGGFLTGLLDGEELKYETVGSLKAISMKSPMGERPSGRLTLLLAPDYAYLCGSMTLAELLAENKSAFKGDAMAKAFAAAGEDDLLLTASLGWLNNPDYLDAKRLTSMVESMTFSFEKNLSRMSARKRGELTRLLKTFLGIGSAEDGLALVDSLAKAAVVELLPEIQRIASTTKGLSVTTTLNGDFSRNQWTLYRAETNARALGAPIPWDAVKPALAAIPGDRDTILFRGRAPEGTGPVLWSRLVDRTASLAQAKGVKWSLLTRLKETLANWRHTPPMESRWPWSLSFQNPKGAMPPTPSPLASPLEKQFGGMWARFTEPWTTVVPGESRLVPERFLAERASNNTANEAALNRFFYDRLGAEWLTGSTRFRVAPPVGKAATLVSEDITTLQLGLFGYQQHEWINREIYYLRPLGEYQLLQKSRLPSAWFSADTLPAAQPVEPGLSRLLAQAPAEAHGVLVDRRLKQMLPLVDDAAQLERLIAAEADAFLKKAQEMVAAHKGDDSALQEKAALLEAPSFVTELLIDENRKVSCKILGVPYPRSLFMAPILTLVSGWRAQAGQAGGAVYAWTETADRMELTMTQDFLGMAQLVTSMGRTIAQKYPGENFDKKMDAFMATFQSGKRDLTSLAKYDGGLFGTDLLESFLSGFKKSF